MLATVKGDVHDIGKNLVDIILTNNGYEVHNLGIKVSIAEMIEKALEVEADAIGMSGLLVKSTLIMRDNLEELNARSLVGHPGAARRRGADAVLRRARPARRLRGPGVLRQGRVRGPVGHGQARRHQAGRRAGRSRLGPGAVGVAGAGAVPALDEPPGDVPSRSPDVADDNPVFVPPFVGTRVVKGLSVEEIAAYVNETALFRNQWGYRPVDGEDDAAFKERIRPVLRDELAKAIAAGILQPAVVYGYFPASSDGQDLVIWSDTTLRSRSWRGCRSRGRRRRRTCASPTSSGRCRRQRSTTPPSTS